MAEEAQLRVQAAVKSFVNDVDKSHLRKQVRTLSPLNLSSNIYDARVKN